MENTHSFRNKLARRTQKYTSVLRNETGIEAVSVSQFLMVCNAGLVSGVGREKIVAIFSQYSTVQNVQMIPQKSYCFVQCVDQSSAGSAFNAIHGKLFLAEVNGPLYLLYIDRMPTENSAMNFHRRPNGLIIVDEFISDDEENVIIDFVLREFQESGSNLKHRLVQHYGYQFDYKTNSVNLDNSDCKQIPEDFDFIMRRMRNHAELKSWVPDQITVNKYEPGQGIPPHVDTHSCFDDFILSLSVGSDIVMDFRNGQDQFSVQLKRKSLLIMSAESRYGWSHGITPRKYDVTEGENGELTAQKRTQRISLTFRRVRESPVCNCSFVDCCDTQKKVKKSRCQFEIDDAAASELERLHVHEVYDEIANHFSETRHKPWPNVEDFVRSFEPGSIFIDVGCGNGKYFGVNSSIYQIGCDRSHKLGEECHKRGYEALICECIALPFRPNTADYCICIAVIHHLSTSERRAQAIKEIARILRPSGRALIYVWAKNQQQDEELSSYLKQRNRNRKRVNEFSAKNEQHSIKLVVSAKSEESEINENAISLPIHVNRTQFKHEDILVPWKLHNKSENKVERTFLRYYHVFEEGELEALCRNVTGIDVIKSYYDQGNWCVMFKKIDDCD